MATVTVMEMVIITIMKVEREMETITVMETLAEVTETTTETETTEADSETTKETETWAAEPGIIMAMIMEDVSH